MEPKFLSSQPEFIHRNFSWSIASFRSVALNVRPGLFASGKFDIFSKCCNLKFYIQKEEKEKDEAGEKINYCVFTIGSEDGDDGGDWVALDKHLEENHKICNQSCTKYLIGDNGKKIPMTETGIECIVGFTCIFEIPKKDLLDEDTPINLLSNGSLEFRVDLQLGTMKHSSVTIPKQLEPAGQLTVKLGHLLGTGAHSDFVIKLGDEGLIKVHKAILAAQSPVFDSMFRAKMKESEENLLNLDFLNPLVVKKFVKYIYTDKLGSEYLDDMYIELLKLADQYQIPRLKALCEIRLIESLSAGNIAGVLSLADTYGADNLLANALKFLEINKSTVASKEVLMELLSQSPKLEKCVLESLSLLEKF